MDTAIVAVKTVILLLGSGITYIAYRAYRRTNARSLGVPSIGFGVITFGVMLAGVVHQILAVSLGIDILINSVLVAIGLAIVLYSLYLERS